MFRLVQIELNTYRLTYKRSTSELGGLENPKLAKCMLIIMPFHLEQDFYPFLVLGSSSLKQEGTGSEQYVSSIGEKSGIRVT